MMEELKREKKQAKEERTLKKAKRKQDAMSTQAIEKKWRKEERDAVRIQREEAHLRKLERQKVPEIQEVIGGVPGVTAYKGVRKVLSSQHCDIHLPKRYYLVEPEP